MGRTGHGDIFFVRYLNATHVEFGLDHWGAGASESGPVAVDYGRPHDLVTAGRGAASARGQRISADYQRSPELAPACAGPGPVLLDGRLVFSTKRPFYPARPGEILFGIALIGGSMTQPGFSGEVLQLAPAPDAAVTSALPLLAAEQSAAETGAGAAGGLGRAAGGWVPTAVHPSAFPGESPRCSPCSPVGASGGGASSSTLRRLDREHLRIGLRQSGAADVLSESLAVSITPGAAQEMELSLRLAVPPAGGLPLQYATDGNFAALRHLLYVRFNGGVVLKAPRQFHCRRLVR